MTTTKITLAKPLADYLINRIYEDDLPLMRRICDAARTAGVTAIIAADVAVLAY